MPDILPQEPISAAAGSDPQLLDQVRAAIIATDASGTITYWNRHAERLYGWTAADVIGRSIADVTVPADGVLAANDIMDRLRAGETWAGEFELRRKNGTTLRAYVSLAPVYGAGNGLSGVVGVSVDVTAERERAEKRLAAQHAVTDVLARSPSIADAAHEILAAIAMSFAWQVGGMWRVNERLDVLELVDVWREGEEAAPVEQGAGPVTFARGVGLPGRVWDAAEAIWLTDFTRDPHFPRSPVAQRGDLRTALGFPIMLGSELLGVIEFFSREVQEPDENLLAMFRVIGSQVAQFIERKQTEEELFAAQERSRLIVESVRDYAIFLIDPDGRVASWNAGAQRITGYAEEEILGQPFARLYPPEQQPEERAAEELARVLAEGHFEDEGWRVRKDGSRFWATVLTTAVRDARGHLRGFSKVIRDSTERYRISRREAAQHAVVRVLAESPTLGHAAPEVLEALATNLGWDFAAMWLVQAGVLAPVDVWSNPSSPFPEFEADTRRRTFGKGVGLPGLVWETGQPKWLRDATADPGFRRQASAAAAGLHAVFGFPVYRRGSVVGVLEFFSREIREPDEDVLSMLTAIGSQIGQFIERKASEQAVAQSEARTRAILESSLDSVVAMDHEGRIREFNPSAERMFGYTRSEAIGREMCDLIIPPALREQHRRGLERYLETGEARVLDRRVEMSAMRNGGEEFPVELAISRVDLPGAPVFTAYIRDITERKRGEEARAMLLESERASRMEAEAAQERLAFLAQAGSLLAGSLDPESTLAKVADLAVPRLADWCIVYMQHDDGSIRRLAMSHPEGQQELSRAIREEFALNPDANEGVPKVIRTGEALVVPNATVESLAADVDDPDRFREVARDLNATSWMCVPLNARGRTIGALSFVSTLSGRRYGAGDLALAEELAHHAALAVDNAVLYKAEQQARRSAERAAVRTSLLQSVTAALSEALSREEVASTIIDRASQAYGAAAGIIALMSEDGHSLELVYDVGYPPEMIEAFRHIEIDAPFPIAEAVRLGEPVIVASPEERAERYPHLGDIPGAYEALAAIPLMLEGRARGAMGLSFQAPRTLSDEDAAFMMALGRQCAQALERARLYEAEHTARTEVEAAHERLSFLAQASDVLSSSLDYTRTLAEVARLAVPRLADWCSVDVVQDGGTIEQLAVAHVDPQKVRYAKELREKYPPDPDDEFGLPNVLRTGRAEIYPHISEEFLLETIEEEELRNIVRNLELRSVMIVPLNARGRTLGAISFVMAESGRSYDEEDLRLAQDLARRAALAVDNSRLYSERDYIARTLQQSLLPPELPAIEGVEVAARYHPAGAGNEVGGDFYDVFESGEGSWGIAIGDVCGKGPDAAALMGIARYTLRAAAMKETRPSRILADMNEAVRRQSTDGRFLTVCYLRLRPNSEGARLTVSCGGHPLPVVLRADGSLETGGRPGTLLGLFPDPDLSDFAIDLAPGDALLLYTDGVMEGPPFEEDGVDARLANVLLEAAGADAEGIAARLDRELLREGDEASRDDMALLVLRVTP